MKFAIFGRGIEVKWSHLLLLVGAWIITSIITFMPIALAASFFFGSFGPESVASASMMLSPVLGIVAIPLMAWMCLYLAGWFKMARDEGLCLSVGGAMFLFSLFLTLFLAMAAFTLLAGNAAVSAYAIAGNIIATPGGAIIFFLWLLLLLGPDHARLKPALANAAIAAFALLLIRLGIAFATIGNMDLGMMQQLGLGDLIMLADNFVWAIPLAYFARKMVSGPEYVFVASLIGGQLLMVLGRAGPALWNPVVDVALNAAFIGAIYLLATRGK
jgi:hypothetical protein